MTNKDKDKELVIKSVGNFVFSRGVDDDGASYIVCRSVSNGWLVQWRDETLMFGVLYPMLFNEDASDYLHSLVTLMYVATTYPHDLVSLTNGGDTPFMEGFLNLVDKQNEYENSLVTGVSPEEDDRILRDTVANEELRNEVLQLSEEDGTVHETSD